MKTNFKIYMKKLKTEAKYMIISERKKLIKIGAIILAVITVAGGTIILFKMREPKTINDKPAKVLELKDNKNNESKMFLEYVEQLKSGIYEVSSLVFGEELMRINETFGKSSDNFVTVQGNFKIKYSIDVTKIKIDYDFDKEEIILKVPKDSVGVDSVELIGEVKEIEKHESIMEKIKDILPGLNDNEYMKEKAINQLLVNSKVEANKYNKNTMQTKAEKSLNELINKLNLNNLKYRIEFVDNTKINIKK